MRWMRYEVALALKSKIDLRTYVCRHFLDFMSCETPMSSIHSMYGRHASDTSDTFCSPDGNRTGDLVAGFENTPHGGGTLERAGG